MSLELGLINCLWLILPLLVWNIVFGSKLNDSRLTSDANSPPWQLLAENGTRILVFALPVLIPLQFQNGTSKAGFVVYLIGTLIYFVSWIPLMIAYQSYWSRSTIGTLAPFITPLFVFWGIALIGQSWGYGIVSILFIILHGWHGVQNLGVEKHLSIS